MNLRVEGKQKRALATKENILGAYRDLASKSAYDQISILQIAEAAGVGKGSVLAHFSEKLALPATLFAQKLDELANSISAGNSAFGTRELSGLLGQILDFVALDDVYARLVVGEGLDVCRQIIEPSDAELFEALQTRLETRLKDQPDVQIQTIRALFSHAVVTQRTCTSTDETKSMMRDLIEALL